MKTPQGAYHLHRQGGFTLIEGVIALVVTAVLASVAVPAAGHMLARYRLVTAQIDLIAALQHARSVAISSRRRTLFCPTATGRQCTGGTHWERGWALGHYRSIKADQLDGRPLLVSGGHARLVIVSTDGRGYVRFLPDGTARGSDITFTLCRRGHPEEALALTVSNMGRAASAKAKAENAANCAAGS